MAPWNILLCYPPYAEGDFTLESTYADVLRHLPPACDITVLSHPAAIDDLRAIISRERPDRAPTVIESPEYLLFSVWAEDGSVTVRDAGRDPETTFLSAAVLLSLLRRRIIADLIAGATDLEATQVALYFQGGNVLAGDDFVLVGIDYLTRTLHTWKQ